MKRIALLVAVLVALATPVHAQNTKAALLSQITATLTSTPGSITPATMTTLLTNMVNSWLDANGGSSLACPTNQFVTGFATLSSLSCAQPTFSNISGTVAAAQLPNPSASTLGGIQSYAAVSHQWINAISTSGVPSSTQPAASDLSNGVTGSGSVVLATSPSISGLTVTSAFTATGLVTNADLAGSIAASKLVGTDIATVGTLTAGTASTGFVVAGVTMTLGSDATGDTYYRNSSGVLTRLGIGLSAQVLTVSGGLPAWAAASVTTITEGTTNIGSGNAPELLTNISGKLQGTGLSVAATPIINWTATSGAPTLSGAAGALDIVESSASGYGLVIFGFGATNPAVTFVEAHGTVASPTAVASGDLLMQQLIGGYDGTANVVGTGEIRCSATQNWTHGSALGTQCAIYTTPNSSITETLAATFGQDQTLNVVGGYKSGGTAGVSKTCAVLPTVVGGLVTAC